MKRFLILIPLLLAFTAVIGCSCFFSNAPVSVRDYNAMPFIVSGIAKEIIREKPSDLNQPVKIVLQVNEVFKGDFTDSIINIYTAASDASCGLFVQKGESWIIWAYLQKGRLETDLCTRSNQIKHVSNTDINTLRELKRSPQTSIWKNEAGVVIAEGRLENQKPIGYWKYYYKDGHIEMEGAYLNEKFHGQWLNYWDPESIVARWKYDKKIPEDSMPDLNGLINRMRHIRHYKNGIAHGDFIYYEVTSIDKPSTFSQYKDGLQNGKAIGYYENGLIYYEQNFLNGKRHGLERFYYSSGQLHKEGKFVDGQLIGAYKYFDESGNPIANTGQK